MQVDNYSQIHSQIVGNAPQAHDTTLTFPEGVQAQAPSLAGSQDFEGVQRMCSNWNAIIASADQGIRGCQVK